MAERCALCDGQRWVRYGNGEDRPCPNCNEQTPEETD